MKDLKNSQKNNDTEQILDPEIEKLLFDFSEARIGVNTVEHNADDTLEACCKIDAFFGAKLQIAFHNLSQDDEHLEFSIGEPAENLVSLLKQFKKAYIESPYATIAKKRPGTSPEDFVQYASDVIHTFENTILEHFYENPFCQTLLPYFFFSFILNQEGSDQTVLKRKVKDRSETTLSETSLIHIPKLSGKTDWIIKQSKYRLLISQKKKLLELKKHSNKYNRFLFKFVSNPKRIATRHDLLKRYLFFYQLSKSLIDENDILNLFYALSLQASTLSQFYSLKKDFQEATIFCQPTNRTIFHLLENGCLATLACIFFTKHIFLEKTQADAVIDKKNALQNEFLSSTESMIKEKDSILSLTLDEDIFLTSLAQDLRHIFAPNQDVFDEYRSLNHFHDSVDRMFSIMEIIASNPK